MMLIILDRDGVINLDSPNYIKTLSEWVPISSSIESIGILYMHGFRFAIASNQSGIAKGYYDSKLFIDIFNAINHLLRTYSARIDLAMFCPHNPSDNCICRKPKPNMLTTICQFYDQTPSSVSFVGDKYTDLIAASNAGCKPVLVDSGFNKLNHSLQLPANTARFKNLSSYAKYLLSQ